MPESAKRDIEQAKTVAGELRRSAERLLARSRALAKEALEIKQRADDLDQLIRQRSVRDGKK